MIKDRYSFIKLVFLFLRKISVVVVVAAAAAVVLVEE